MNKKTSLIIGYTVMSKVVHSIKRTHRRVLRVRKPCKDDLDKPGSINRVWVCFTLMHGSVRVLRFSNFKNK